MVLKLNKYNICLLLFLFGATRLNAQSLTLNEAVSIAREQSVSAKEAKYNFISAYWAYRTYMASLLPSLSFYGTVGNFNRSLVLLQEYDTGDLKYSPTNNLQNSMGLSLRQMIPATGGSFSIYTDLYRIDQFGNNSKVTWYSQPVTASYSQPLFGYNKMKWDKVISPKAYEKSRKVYIESMEKLTGEVVSHYYDLVLAEMKLMLVERHFSNSQRMLDIASRRLAIGSIRRNEYLQLELNMLNDSLSIAKNKIEVRKSQMALNSLLGYDEFKEIHAVIEDELPDILMSYDFVLVKAMENSSVYISDEIDILNAQSSVAEAKADRGISMQINARFGLSKTDPTFRDAYTRLDNQEVVGLTFSIPIFDWGTGRGKIQKAKAAEEVTHAHALQRENDFRIQLFTSVGQFNNQKQQCVSSKMVKDVAEEYYFLVMESFSRGEATVLELNNAQSDFDAAYCQYITDICNYWRYYYNIRQLTLYDFVYDRNIDVNPEELIEN